MKHFLELVLKNIEKFWWTENTLNLMESCMGAKSSDHIIFKINEDVTTTSFDVTVFDNNEYKSLAPKNFSFDSDEGKLIKEIFDASRNHIILSDKCESTKQENRYMELVTNSEKIIRVHFA